MTSIMMLQIIPCVTQVISTIILLKLQIEGVSKSIVCDLSLTVFKQFPVIALE